MTAEAQTVFAAVESLIDQSRLKDALKPLEKERRAALSRGDVAGDEGVLEGARAVYARADGKRQGEAGRIAFAAQQNIRLLGRKAALAAGEEWVDPFSPPGSAARQPSVDDRPRSMFGDPRRLRSLGLALTAGVGTFPLWWIAAMIAWGMGGDNGDEVASPRPADGGRHSVHVIVVVSAALAAATLVAMTIHWIRARRRVPAADRVRPTRNEGFSYGAGLVLLLGAAVGLFVVLWTFTPLRSEFAPYTS